MSNISESEILKRLKFPADIFVLNSVDSTNTFAFDLLKSGNYSIGFDKLSLVVTRTQNNGYGRMGRRWFSAGEGESLCMSLLVPIKKDAKNIASFTVRAGIEICSKLRELTDSLLYLKWPNDIYDSNDKKLAGMIAQMFISNNENPHYIVFGVGLNIDLTNCKIPADISKIANCLKSVSEKDINISECVALIADAVHNTANFFNKENCVDTLQSDFDKYDTLKGRSISAMIGDKRYSGIASGIDASGALLIKTEDSLIPLNSGEATLLKPFNR